jgi:tRNA1(Val) A37 N6-methylase TrmN6
MTVRISGFLGGRLQLAQDERGHRVGLDAALLAAATPVAASGLILDLGAGVGAVGLSSALLAPRARIGLVEIAPQAAALARENIRLNRLEERARVHETDFVSPSRRRAVGLVDEEAEVVLTNPPHHAKGSVRISPDSAKALAHVAEAPLPAWTRAALALLAPGGTFAMIHRAEALADCLAALGGRVGGLAILPVHPRDGAKATRVLLRGVKGSKAPLSLLPPLVLHHADGAYSPLADAILRGLRPAPL